MKSTQPQQFSLRLLAALHLLLQRILEVFQRPDWLELNNSSNLRKDIFAGLTGATLVLPQAVAFAAIAGLRKGFRKLEADMPPQVHMLLIIKGTGSIDLPAAELLAEEAKRRKRRGGMLWPLTKNPALRFAVTAGSWALGIICPPILPPFPIINSVLTPKA